MPVVESPIDHQPAIVHAPVLCLLLHFLRLPTLEISTAPALGLVTVRPVNKYRSGQCTVLFDARNPA